MGALNADTGPHGVGSSCGKYLGQDSQPGVILSPKGLLEIPEDLFGHHVLAGEVPWYTKWGETRMLPTFTAE